MKLGWRILLLVLFTTTISSLANLLLTQYQEKQLYAESEKVLVATVFQLLRNTLVQDVLDGNRLRVANLLKKLANHDNPIEYLYVSNVAQKVFAHSFVNGFPRYLLNQDNDYPNQPGMTLSQKYLTSNGQIYQYSESLIRGLDATLHVGINQSDIRKRLAENSLSILILSGIIALLTLVIAYFWSRRIIAPLVLFTQQLRRYGRGDSFDFNIAESGAEEIQQLAATFQQVTSDRLRALKALQENEQDLLITLNSIGDAVITTDAKGQVTRMNPVAEQMTGWSFPEAEGQPLKNIFQIINASTREAIVNPVEKVLATGEIVHLSNHTTLIARNGTEYQIADSAAPIRNGDDRILGMVLVFNDVTEAYRLREKENSMQQRLQGLLDDMQTMVVITTVDGMVSYANSTPLKISGIELDDVIGRKIWDCKWLAYDPEMQAIAEHDLNQALSGNNVLRDIQIATADGLLWIAYSIYPITNAEGLVTQLLHEGRDISHRKQIEDEMRDSAQHLRLYREQTPIAAIEWNVDFQVIDWNSAAEKMFGYSLDEVKGRNFVDILLPESAVVDVKQIWKDLISQSGGTKSTNENLTKDGKIILCEWYNTPLVDDSGKVIGAASLVLDITAQDKAQQALIAREQEQRQILDFMLDAVISIDENGSILSFNKTAETLFGYSSEEAMGRNVKLLMPNPYEREHDGYLQGYMTTGVARIVGIGREVEGQHKNGETFPMRLSIAELPRDDVTGKRRFIGTCHDLTDFKKQEEQLHRSQKMDALGKMTGGIAHDYNNMLGVIMGYSELLESQLMDQPKLARYAHLIHHAGQRGSKLTKKLLSFSRKIDHEADKLDLNELLMEQQDILQKTLTVRIDLCLDFADELWAVWLDASDLEDAVLNISINAMHAMEDGGTLTIGTSNQCLNEVDAKMLNLTPGDYVQLSFADSGHGMDEATMERIFDPFFSTKGDKGTGLGLAQVFAFTRRAGGTIRVYSEPGHGTQFILFFPRYHKENEAVVPLGKKVEADGGDETILIVDDEIALRELAVELLTAKGYQVKSAKDAKQALQILEQETFDLMLTDVIMPGMDGYQLAAQVQDKYPQVKIQLASGFNDARHIDLVDEFLQQNMIFKPYSSKNLFEKIRNLLDN